jgi:BlaI family penicillinase repressor
MARPESDLLTPREAQLMDILWAQGPATAETVRAALRDPLHDSTVRTLLRVLVKKGYARLRGKQPTLYAAKITQAQVQKKATRNLLARFFAGSAEALMLRLVEDEKLSPEQLDHIRQSIANRP